VHRGKKVTRGVDVVISCDNPKKGLLVSGLVGQLKLSSGSRSKPDFEKANRITHCLVPGDSRFCASDEKQ